MAGSTGRWDAEREAATSAARGAGGLLLDYLGRCAARRKGSNDLVTDADLASQAAIRMALARKFPDDDFLEEEGSHEIDREARRRWFVDPLDGTKNFVHGFPFFCVSIGLEVDGQLVVGVVYDPLRKECFAASAKGGFACNGAPQQISASHDISQSLLCMGMPSDPMRKAASLGTFGRLSFKAQSVHRMGSAALALAYVACGRLDGFWAERLHPWDCAAGVLLVQEAGGQVTNQDGSPYNLYTPDVLATNGLIHRSMVDAIVSDGPGVIQ
jgi:myo-inositol-1(or 4)-monophosphatase